MLQENVGKLGKNSKTEYQKTIILKHFINMGIPGGKLEQEFQI